MATLGVAPMFLSPMSDLSAKIMHGLEKASQTYKQGALLVHSSGQLEECGADPTNITGVALADATGVTDADVPFLVPRESDEFEATFSIAALTYALVGNEEWGRYGMIKDSASGFWIIDQGETTADIVVVTRLISPVGTVNPRVLCRFLPGVLFAA